ncbi:MAG: hypothetical protein F6J97_02100 [Leptolyngbya sp. SIO4C1]|nr:hypothetical protein [Leptolyngbya sp. SIO4C1]
MGANLTGASLISVNLKAYSP